MALYEVRNAAGFPQIVWQMRQAWKRRRAASWVPVEAKVEGHEVLLARNNGWVVAFYSYSLNGKSLSGEWRKWFSARPVDYQSEAEKIMDRVAKGQTIAVRVDPREPSNSVAEIPA
jgi:hypothetical protein